MPILDITSLLGMSETDITTAALESITGKRYTPAHAAAAAAMQAFVTQDPRMLEMKKSASLLSWNPYNVLIYGESGTGKELLARIIHGSKEGRFCAINCAGLPEKLIESELFGHVKGAFTDASVNKIGLIKSAEGGTVFMDEVGELPPEAQAKLLRVLDSKIAGQVITRPVGGIIEEVVTTRFIFASNRNLVEMVAAKTFRLDLFYRIAQFELETTPLRDRPADVRLIAESIIASNGWTPLTEDIPPTAYDRGNVRQLFNWLLRKEIPI